jgi:catechol 2,3-dioxygenase-like lactoylglutathione lyase family enzyme
MLARAVQLIQAILFVDDVASALLFYRDLLGLRVLREEPGWVRLDSGGSVLALHAIHHRDATSAPAAPRVGSRHKLCFHTDDVDQERARLVAAGVAMRDVHRYSEVTFCDGVDPEGNIFQITTY